MYNHVTGGPLVFERALYLLNNRG